MSTKTLIEITCDPCEARGKKDVDGETIVVAGVKFDVCPRDRKPLDAYLKSLAAFEEFARKYGRAENDRPIARPASTRRRRAANVTTVTGPDLSGNAEKDSGPAAGGKGQRVKCGLCSQEVAHASRAWHAKHYHDLKTSGIEWLEA